MTSAKLRILGPEVRAVCRAPIIVYQVIEGAQCPECGGFWSTINGCPEDCAETDHEHATPEVALHMLAEGRDGILECAGCGTAFGVSGGKGGFQIGRVLS